ncbi:MAG TPA: alpha/beta hydrolase [Solirubrobacteraceae bacterium]|jgi:pimeloyl-ACP methyl ester carboxylesterase|nr:alpha/beta hydrolase [Solirubrobacteraceae bacterium]
MPISDFPPEPPIDLPPARTVHVKGRGEFFVRDSGLFDTGSGRPTVMLLHGWMATADLNWVGVYQDLITAGYRVLAIDHRGHGRGLRPLRKFRLSDCAADAAGVLRTLGLAPALVVGYSMGGAIAQLMTREQPDAVSGLVLSGTAQHWQEPALRRYWLAMGAMGLSLAVFPSQFWRLGVRRSGIPAGPRRAWLQSELMRHSARDVAEAGRELGRFDSRPWLKRLEVPSAMVLTSRDDLVPPSKQRELAQALEADIYDAPIRHLQVTTAGAKYNQPLLQALQAVRDGRQAQAA